MFYSAEQIKKMFPPADKTGTLPPATASIHLAWDPFYRFTVMRRPYYDPPRARTLAPETCCTSPVPRCMKTRPRST